MVDFLIIFFILAIKRIESQIFKDRILYGGYRLRRDRILADGGTAWRCPRKNCSGRLKITHDKVVIVVTEHNHAPDPRHTQAKDIEANARSD